MLDLGSFTHFYHFDREDLFKNASIDVIIFRYQLNFFNNNVVYYNNDLSTLKNCDGMIIFIDINNETYKISEYFDVYVGLVSGADKVFKNEQYSNIEVLTGNNKREKYILIDNFPTSNDEFNSYFLSKKDILISRKIRKFNDTNWYQWGALRNYDKIVANWDRECIYVHNLTRNEKIAFKGNVEFFGGNLLIMIPKTDIDLNQCLDYLNSLDFKSNFMYAGRFKIGQRQLANSYFKIPHL